MKECDPGYRPHGPPAASRRVSIVAVIVLPCQRNQMSEQGEVEKKGSSRRIVLSVGIGRNYEASLAGR